MELICIHESVNYHKLIDGKSCLIQCEELTWGRKYKIQSHHDSKIGKRYYSLINDKGISNDYQSYRFVTQEEFRDLQLNKIL